jgi:hypothetical protein
LANDPDYLRIRIGGDIGVDYNSSYVFVVITLGSSGHDWELTNDQKLLLIQEIESNGGENATSDKCLALPEMLGFVDDDDSRKIVKELPASVHGLLNKELVKDAFRTYDSDKSGFLDTNEFFAFIDLLEDLHFKYLLSSAFQTFRAFWGRGQATMIYKLEQDRIETPWLQQPLLIGSTVQIGYDPDCRALNKPVPPGYWQDFYYYSANNHPLHGIFACDPGHPFSWLERLTVELATIMFSYFTTAGDANVLFVSFAGTIMWNVLFLCFTTPCLRRNQGDTSPECYRRSQLASNFFSLGGYLSVILGMLFLWWTGTGEEVVPHMWPVLRGRFLSYFIFWAMMFGIYFNLFVAWGQTEADGGFSLGNHVGLGQWRIEKQRFRNAYLHRKRQQAANSEDNAATPVAQGMPVAQPMPVADAELDFGKPLEEASVSPQESTSGDADPALLEDGRVQVVPQSPPPSVRPPAKPPSLLASAGTSASGFDPEMEQALKNAQPSPRAMIWLEDEQASAADGSPIRDNISPRAPSLQGLPPPALVVGPASYLPRLACEKAREVQVVVASEDTMYHISDWLGDEDLDLPKPQVDSDDFSPTQGAATKRGLNKIPTLYLI